MLSELTLTRPSQTAVEGKRKDREKMYRVYSTRGVRNQTAATNEIDSYVTIGH